MIGARDDNDSKIRVRVNVVGIDIVLVKEVCRERKMEEERVHMHIICMCNAYISARTGWFVIVGGAHGRNEGFCFMNVVCYLPYLKINCLLSVVVDE